jgi:hypothetical protein
VLGHTVTHPPLAINRTAFAVLASSLERGRFPWTKWAMGNVACATRVLARHVQDRATLWVALQCAVPDLEAAPWARVVLKQRIAVAEVVKGAWWSV